MIRSFHILIRNDIALIRGKLWSSGWLKVGRSQLDRVLLTLFWNDKWNDISRFFSRWRLSRWRLPTWLLFCTEETTKLQNWARKMKTSWVILRRRGCSLKTITSSCQVQAFLLSAVSWEGFLGGVNHTPAGYLFGATWEFVFKMFRSADLQ